jgi:putative peptidoglycan lipid II flippase
LIVPAIYALKDTRTPVLISIRVVIINFILNLLSLWFLPEYWKHAGMAFSTVLSEGFGMIMLFRHLNKYIPPINSIALLKNALYHLIKAFIMVIIGSLIFNLLSNISSFSEKFSQIYSLGITIILSIIIYAFLSKSNPEQIEIFKVISKKSR